MLELRRVIELQDERNEAVLEEILRREQKGWGTPLERSGEGPPGGAPRVLSIAQSSGFFDGVQDG